jgi:azurin
MKTKLCLLSAIALAEIGVGILPAADDSKEFKTVVITAGDALKFNVTQIDAQAGQKMRIQLLNQSALPKEVIGHNWVLLKVGMDANKYAMAAKDEGYQPKALADQVYIAIPLVGPKGVGEVTFDAPAIPGRYPFLCSFPAHCMSGMRGELIVK